MLSEAKAHAARLRAFCWRMQNGLVALPDHFSALVNLCVLDAHANPFPCLPEVGSACACQDMYSLCPGWGQSMSIVNPKSGVGCCLCALAASSQVMVFSLPRLHSIILLMIMLAFNE